MGRAAIHSSGSSTSWRAVAGGVVFLFGVVACIALSPLYLAALARLQHSGERLGCSKFVRACTLLLIVIVLWTASSVATQSLVFEGAHYRKPFFVTYATTAMLAIYLPFYPRRFCRLVAACADACAGRTRAQRYDSLSRAGSRTVSAVDDPEAGDALGAPAAARRPARPTNPLVTLGTACRLGLLFFGFQVSFNVGLELSTVASATVIAASSGLWTLLLSALRLRERVGPVKFVAVLLSFSGVAAVVAHSSQPGGHGKGDSPALGNGAALLSAVLYGCYATQLKLELGGDDAPMPFLFGLVGLINVFILLPFLPWLHFVGLERFAWPSARTAAVMGANALFGSVLSNTLLARAMLLASPLVATVGLSLSIPLAVASDVARGRGHFTPGMLLGTLAVWFGFVGVSIAAPLEAWVRLRLLRWVRSGADGDMRLEMPAQARLQRI